MRNWILALFLMLPLTGCGDEDATTTEGTSEGTAEGTSEGTEVTAPTGPADTSMPGDPEAGREVYVANCQACHGANGRGNGGVGGDFVGEPERLQQDNSVLLAKIADGITGARTMPPQRDLLTEEQRRDALSFIRQEFGGDAD